MVEESLNDLLEKASLPILARVTRGCVLKGKEVLTEGQFLVVLDRKKVQLVFGKDAQGREFRISADNGEDLLIECVEDFYPTSPEEALTLLTEATVNHVQLNKKFGLSNLICTAGERFIYSSESAHINEITGENTLSFIREMDNSIVNLPVQALINKSFFTFVKVTERINLQSLLRTFSPQKVVFVNAVADRSLPIGISKLDAVWTYETILTATIISNRVVRYEMFPLDSRILVEECQPLAMPKFVVDLGGKNSQSYFDKLKRVQFIMYFDVYSPRFYGFVDEEEILTKDDELLICRELERTKSAPEKPVRRMAKAQSFDESYSRDLPLEPQAFRSRAETTNDAGKKSVLSSMRKVFSRGRKKSSPLKERSSPLREKPSPLRERGNSFPDIEPQTSQTSQTSPSSVLRRTGNTPSPRLSNGSPRNGSPRLSHPICPSTPEEEISEEQDSDTLKNMNRIAENPLYGYDTPKRLSPLPLHKHDDETSATKIKSKPFTNDELKKRKNITPCTLPLFSSPESENNDVFTPTHGISEREILINQFENSRKRDSCPVPIQRVAASTNQPPQISRSWGQGDSGIDSPDTIYAGIIDSPDTIYDNVNTERKIKPKPAPRKQRNIHINSFRGNTLYRNRWKSEPCLDIPSHDLAVNPRRSFELESESPYSTLDYTKVKNLRLNGNRAQEQEIKSLNSVKEMGLDEVVQLLIELRLKKYSEACKTNLLNGKLLSKLEEEHFSKDLEMTKFEARKLYRYIHGWRENTVNLNSEQMKTEDMSDWSVLNVRNELTSINLQRLATFCAENQVDGTLLIELHQDEDLLDSVSIEHGVRLTSIEKERLHGYLNNELHYEDHEKTRVPKFSKRRTSLNHS